MSAPLSAISTAVNPATFFKKAHRSAPPSGGSAPNFIVTNRHGRVGSQEASLVAQVPANKARAPTAARAPQIVRRRALLLAEPFGDALRHPVPIDAGQHRMSLGQQFSLAIELVIMFNLGGRHAAKDRPQTQPVVVSGRAAILALHPHDYQKLPSLFHLAVASASGAEHFSTPHFKPGEVVGMMDDAHRVSFLVADAEFDFVPGVGHGDVAVETRGNDWRL
jgi:hypothetical protein